MNALNVHLLGTPRIELNSEIVNVKRRKALAILAYLAVTRQAQSRDTLAALLWPDYDQSSARANLRRDLFWLKDAVGEEVLEVDRDQISLNFSTGLWVDVSEFQTQIETVQNHDHERNPTVVAGLCEVCQGALKWAVEIYESDFMTGFGLPDSPVFDEWQFFQNEGLRRQLSEALQRLIDWHRQKREYTSAIQYGRRWLAQDNLHEPAHRVLMELYALTGEHAAALRQYRECKRILKSELGVEPDDQTRFLYKTIHDKQYPSPNGEQLLSPIEASKNQVDSAARYVQVELLSSGGHGDVYLGNDSQSGQTVIIKRLRPELISNDPQTVARFVQEGQILEQLNHPNIVGLLAAIEHDGIHSLVMEYIPGGALRELLTKEKQLPLNRTLDLALELTDALGRAHHLGIIHRDLKPENVLIAHDGTPRLTDFGLARLSRENTRLTQTGAIIGSPVYMSPEAARGEELDARSDIWSFGILLFECLAGRLPFDGEQITSILLKILKDPLPDIKKYRPDIPDALESLLNRMLVKDRQGRIASIRQVAAELEAIRDGRVLTPPTTLALAAPTDNQPENFPINDSTINRKIDQEIRFCISQDGVKLAYARVGNGPPLVKAANWLSHLEYEWQSPVWRHWIEGLSRHHTLIRYDERGCGLSDWNVGELSLEAWVSDLEAVVDAAGLERFPLLGISQGGAIAITYAVRHPEKVSHLILYGAYTRGKLRRNLSPAQEEEIMTLIQLIKVGWGKENPVFRQVYTSLFMPEGTPEQHAWFNELQRVSSTPETAARIVTGFGEIDVRQLATAVSAPTLILHATGDARVPFDEGRLAASLIPGARFVPLESKNHLLIETEPAWGQFLEEVEGFLIEDASNASEEKAIKPNMITNTV